VIRPPALRPGARVSLVAPAGPLADGAVARATARVRAWGWEPLPGSHCEGSHGFLSAPDEARAADLDGAVRSADNDAIWCLRGGYGTMRILDAVHWPALRERPRALVGFSDNTAIHLAVQREGVVSFHGPHPATVDFSSFSARSLRRLLEDPAPAGVLPFPEGGPTRGETVAPGVAEGPLVGGNLSLLAATLGTPYAVRAEGAILFLEDVGEASYRLDRLLTQLRLSGVLERVAGIALGGFTDAPDEGRRGVPSSAEVLRERLGGLGVPVAAALPFGHIDESWTLPLGVRARLDADAGTLELLEGAVEGPPADSPGEVQG
jgi:muramoyltetrapeptide carboxypeptidase